MGDMKLFNCDGYNVMLRVACSLLPAHCMLVPLHFMEAIRTNTVCSEKHGTFLTYCITLSEINHF